MILSLNKKEIPYSDKFMDFFCKRLGENILASIDLDELIRWDVLFLLLRDSKGKIDLSNIHKIDVLAIREVKEGSAGITLPILVTACKNLVYTDSKDFCIVEINPSLKVKNFSNGSKLSDICSLINYGNIDIKGYPVFTEGFRKAKDNINYYISTFNWGLPIA